MAKLPVEIAETLWSLKKQALEVVEMATSIEYSLFEHLRETEASLPYLGEMKSVAESATRSYSRLSTIHLQITSSQPLASPDLLRFLYETINLTVARLPALERSIQEVKQEWDLP